MERKEAIRSAYRLTGSNSFYDGMITCTTLSGKAVWQNKFKICYKFVDKDSEKEVLQAAANLLDNIRSKSDLKIGDDSLGDYLSNGLFYKMSDTSIQKDGNAIGWHPKWNELFNGNNNG